MRAMTWVKERSINDFDLLSPLQKAWAVECLSSFPEFRHYAAAECAEELPDELSHLQNLADEDEDFEFLFEDWENYSWKKASFKPRNYAR